MAQNEAAMKQASSASNAARKLIDDAAGKSINKDEVEKLQSEVNSLKEGEFVNTPNCIYLLLANIYNYFLIWKELASSGRDRDAMKSQAESVTKEYDRLLKEHEKLQRKIAQGDGDKKAD